MLAKHHIVAICEPDLITARAAKEAFPRARLLTEVSQLTSDGLDVVWECGHLLGRKCVHQWAVENRIPIVLEKPLALKESDLASFTSGRFTIDFPEIYHPVIKIASDFLVSEGTRIKAVSFFRANTIAAEKVADPQYRTGVIGGSLLDKGVHDIANLSLCIAPSKSNSLKNICVLNKVLSTSDSKGSFHTQYPISENLNTDLYSDTAFVYETPTQSFPVRLITSWIGIEPHQTGISYPDIIQRVFWRANVPNISYPFPCASEHCKFIVAEFTSPMGNGTLIGSTLRRPGCYPFLIVRFDREEHQLFPTPNREKKKNTNSCDEAIQRACSATKMHTHQLINVHRIAFQLRQAVMCT